MKRFISFVICVALVISLATVLAAVEGGVPNSGEIIIEVLPSEGGDICEGDNISEYEYPTNYTEQGVSGYDERGIPLEGGGAPNPSTGITLAFIPAIIAAACAVISKSK